MAWDPMLAWDPMAWDWLPFAILPRLPQPTLCCGWPNGGTLLGEERRTTSGWARHNLSELLRNLFNLS